MPEVKTSTLTVLNLWNGACWITWSSGWLNLKEGRSMSTTPWSMLHSSSSQNIPVKEENPDKNVLNLDGSLLSHDRLVMSHGIAFCHNAVIESCLLRICLHPCLRFQIPCISCHRFWKQSPGVAEHSDGALKCLASQCAHWWSLSFKVKVNQIHTGCLCQKK